MFELGCMLGMFEYYPTRFHYMQRLTQASTVLIPFTDLLAFQCRLSVFPIHFRLRFSFPQQVLNSLQSGLPSIPFLDRNRASESSVHLPSRSINNNSSSVSATTAPATAAAPCCVPPEVLITPAPPRSDEELSITNRGGR